MGVSLSDSAYCELIQKDIDWLLENTEHCLERTHIISILREHEKDVLKNGK